MYKKLEIRALQIDLARHMETPEYICKIMDFAVKFDYNTIFLYLEDRIRTASYPYPDKRESYSPETIQKWVSYATKLNLDVIPVVSTLGHVERFLRFFEMKHLAEVKDGVKPRLGNGQDVFCPTLEDTYTFWERYLSELAEVFPSPYFHIGCDEVWNLGLCSECQNVIAEGKSIGDIFSYHIGKINQIISNLGKQTIIWEDMLEEYPDVLNIVSAKNIILCIWQYETDVKQTSTHFGNRSNDHRMAEYDKHGVKYIIGSWTKSLLNVETLASYSANFHPVGAVTTRWEGSFLEQEALISAFAGRRWANISGNRKELFNNVVEELFGIKDLIFIESMWTLACTELWNLDNAPWKLLNGNVSTYGNEYRNTLKLIELNLQPWRKKINNSFGINVFDDILSRIKLDQASFTIKDILQDICQNWTAGKAISSKLLEDFHNEMELLNKLILYWNNVYVKRRPGCSVNCGNPAVDIRAFQKMAGNLIGYFTDKQPAFQGLLRVRYALPEYYGSPTVKWSALYEDELEWQEIFNANTKLSFRDFSDRPFFNVVIPIYNSAVPQRLKIEYQGYCGIGLLYLEYFSNGKVYRPASITNISGIVKGEKYILQNNSLWCRLGKLSSHGAFSTTSEVELHSLEIELKASNVPLL